MSTKRQFDRQVDGLVSEEIEGEMVVVHPDSGEAHALNGSAALVFQLCDGRTSRPKMAEHVAERFNLPAETEVVDLALGELVDAGLVVAIEPVESISRRQVLRRLGMTAAAAAMLPVIETMVIRPAAASVSGPLPPLIPGSPQTPQNQPQTPQIP